MGISQYQQTKAGIIPKLIAIATLIYLFFQICKPKRFTHFWHPSWKVRLDPGYLVSPSMECHPPLASDTLTWCFLPKSWNWHKILFVTEGTQQKNDNIGNTNDICATLSTTKENTHIFASSKRSSNIRSVRTCAKCRELFSRFLNSINSGIFSKAPYL